MASQSYGPQDFLYHEDCTSLVELSISCSGLPKMDLFSKSDPFVSLHLREGSSYRKIGQTEVIMNNHEPKFEKVIQMQYNFEEEQILKFVVADYDSATKSDHIGIAHMRLAELVSSGEPSTYDLKDKGRLRGKITISAEELTTNKAKVIFEIRCTKLDKKDFFGKSDPYFEIKKIREGGRSILVYRSKVVMSNLNPSFEKFDIPMSTLCSGDYNTPLKIDVYDWNTSGKVDHIGGFKTSFQEISPEHGGIKDFLLLNPVLQKKKCNKYKNSGIFHFTRVDLIPVHTFLDHLKGGLQIQLIIAVDFTGSNGNPSDPKSLHYIGTFDNEYMEVLKSVGSILVPYDADQMIPAFGFGAKLPPQYDHALHCFPLNGQSDPEVPGVQGIIDSYRYTLASCRLSGPTLFTEVLSYAKCTAESQQNEYAYTILLIITDGVINDMKRSSDLIVESSELPLSIVIVGVGDADFTDMHVLDADDTPLIHSITRKLMSNDIVQFVPMREVKRSNNQFNLAKEVLDEIPGQIITYMSNNKITPHAPTARHFKLQPVRSITDISIIDGQMEGLQLDSAAPGALPTRANINTPGYPPQTQLPMQGYPGYPPQGAYPGYYGSPVQGGYSQGPLRGYPPQMGAQGPPGWGYPPAGYIPQYPPGAWGIPPQSYDPRFATPTAPPLSGDPANKTAPRYPAP